MLKNRDRLDIKRTSAYGHGRLGDDAGVLETFHFVAKLTRFTIAVWFYRRNVYIKVTEIGHDVVSHKI